MPRPSLSGRRKVSILVERESGTNNGYQVKSRKCHDENKTKSSRKPSNVTIPDFDSISQASNSYEMVEYGLNPYEAEELKPKRKRSCVCEHPDPDILIKETEDSEFFPDDFISRIDHLYTTDSEVPPQSSAIYSNTCPSPQVSFQDKLITGALIGGTLLTIFFLFWYQNFGAGTFGDHH